MCLHSVVALQVLSVLLVFRDLIMMCLRDVSFKCILLRLCCVFKTAVLNFSSNWQTFGLQIVFCSTLVGEVQLRA